MDSADRDFAITTYALRNAIISGLDARYIPSKVNSYVDLLYISLLVCHIP